MCMCDGPCDPLKKFFDMASRESSRVRSKLFLIDSFPAEDRSRSPCVRENMARKVAKWQESQFKPTSLGYRRT